MLSPAMRLLGIGTRDPYYSSVDVLLPLTVDGSDAGPSSRSVTVTGSPSYSSAGVSLNGSSQYLNYTGSAIGSGEFIIEGFFKPSSPGGTIEVLLDTRPDGVNGAYMTLSCTAASEVALYVDSLGGFVATSSTTLTSGTEYYIAIFRKSGTSYLQLDDTIEGSWSDSTNYLASADRPFLGAASLGTGLSLYHGTIHDFRVTIGTDRDRAASISGSTAYVPPSPFPTS